jgi:hypothetical protein
MSKNASRRPKKITILLVPQTLLAHTKAKFTWGYPKIEVVVQKKSNNPSALAPTQ